MSPRQEELVRAIKEYRAANGCQPTQAELAVTLGVSRTRVDHIVAALERRGVVHRFPGKARTIHVLEPA